MTRYIAHRLGKIIGLCDPNATCITVTCAACGHEAKGATALTAMVAHQRHTAEGNMHPNGGR